MLFSLYSFAVLLLAGRAIAQNLRLNLTLGTGEVVFVPSILDFDLSNIAPRGLDECTSTCDAARTTLTACNEDISCLCSNESLSPLQSCQQCMFDILIREFAPMPDPRVGSNVLLGAYATFCKTEANATLDASLGALEIPENWEGPFGLFVPVGGVAVAVIVGFGLGVSSILILSNM